MNTALPITGLAFAAAPRKSFQFLVGASRQRAAPRSQSFGAAQVVQCPIIGYRGPLRICIAVADCTKYLPVVTQGATIRLLAREKMASLIPAATLYQQQSGSKVEVRSASNFHDRYLFVDKAMCYQSGSSFKDGAKKAPTTLTQIKDAFQAVLVTYEGLWSAATVHL